MNLRRSLLKYSMSLPLATIPGVVVATAPNAARADSAVTITGTVSDQKTGEKIEDALVILQCSCLQGVRETTTNADGIYAFRNLPPGKFTVQVLVGDTDVNKSMDVPAGAQSRANFQIGADRGTSIDIVVTPPIRRDGATGVRINMEESGKMPIGGIKGNWTGVLDSTPTVSQDAAGARFSGTSGAESKYMVDGQNATSPAFGTCLLYTSPSPRD